MSQRLFRIVVLSNVYDQHYHDLRGEDVPRCLSWAKRRDLFHCLEVATGRKVLVLSSPPKALRRRTFRRLRPVETRFATHRQFFCGNWDGPKLRILFSWLFYPWHVLRNVASGDLVLIDNYEIIYVLAAWLVRIFRKVTFVLDYEDGKHLIDRSWSRILSAAAEKLGRPLMSGAVLAHPALGLRLPGAIPKELVPGVIAEAARPADLHADQTIRILYAGSLDAARGLDLLLASLPLLPESGWHISIAGTGPLRQQIEAAAREPRWMNRLSFFPPLQAEAYRSLLRQSHIGLNCQRASDPISSVTFPSKLFTYFSSGLLVVSSTASNVEEICGNACIYYREDKPEALALAIQETIRNFSTARQKVDYSRLFDLYSLDGTVRRLRELVRQIETKGRNSRNGLTQ